MLVSEKIAIEAQVKRIVLRLKVKFGEMFPLKA